MLSPPEQALVGQIPALLPRVLCADRAAHPPVSVHRASSGAPCGAGSRSVRRSDRATPLACGHARTTGRAAHGGEALSLWATSS
ncbi:MAG: hypothetical protein M3Y74_17275 [Chloroflexota bacterium]|nr:hypothetical protein [Chloroflexota bacterium]